MWALFMSFIQHFENFFFFLPGTPCFVLLFLTEEWKITFTETNSNEFLIARNYTDWSHQKL